MHCPVVNVRRHSFNGLTVIVDARVSLRLLFIGNVIWRISVSLCRVDERQLLTHV